MKIEGCIITVDIETKKKNRKYVQKTFNSKLSKASTTTARMEHLYAQAFVDDHTKFCAIVFERMQQVLKYLRKMVPQKRDCPQTRPITCWLQDKETCKK